MNRFLTLCLAIAMSAHSVAHASLIGPVTYASPFLILDDGTDDARVALIRPGGVFLMLKLSDGSLLARHEPYGLSSITEFRLLDDYRIGVAAWNGYRIFDGRTGELLAESERRNPIFAGDFVFSSSESEYTTRNVSATDWRTGETVWTVDLPAGPRMVAYGDGSVIVGCVRFPPPTELGLCDFFFIAFDARTGEEEWRVTFKASSLAQMILIDDTLYASDREPNLDRSRLWRWNLEGKPLDDESVFVGLREEHPLYENDWHRRPFRIPAGASVNGRPPRPLNTPFGQAINQRDDYTLRAISGDTVLSARVEWVPGVRFDGIDLEYRDGEYLVWSGRLSQVYKNRGMVYALALTNDFALVASDSGQIEAIDRKTGRSRWIFHFPIHMPKEPLQYPRGGPSIPIMEYRMSTEEDWRRDPRAAAFIGFRPDGVVDAPPCPVHVFEPWTRPEKTPWGENRSFPYFVVFMVVVVSFAAMRCCWLRLKRGSAGPRSQCELQFGENSEC